MAEEEYKWSADTMACVATYKILEEEDFLDQFEDADVPFKDAAELEMRRLRYYPATTVNASIIKLLSIQMAQLFYRKIIQTYTVGRQRPQRAVGQTIDDLAAVFAKPTGKLIDLAKIVDDDLRFPGEPA
jgi:hypothetical protein